MFPQEIKNMTNRTDVNLPKFDLEIYETAIELGESEEEAFEVAIEAMSDFEPLDSEHLGLDE